MKLPIDKDVSNFLVAEEGKKIYRKAYQNNWRPPKKEVFVENETLLVVAKKSRRCKDGWHLSKWHQSGVIQKYLYVSCSRNICRKNWFF